MSSGTLKTNQGIDASPRLRDSELDFLLESTRPDVAPLSADTANRILSNVMRETALCTPRVSIAGTRTVLSAAFCVCAAAGLLLLRSVASVRGARQQTADRQVAARTYPVIHTVSGRRCANTLVTRDSAPGAISLSLHRSLTHRAPIVVDDACAPYLPPPNPVCGMTTFAIFTALSGSALPRDNQGNSDDSEGGSLLVCVVNAGDQCDATGAGSKGDTEKSPISTEVQPSIPFIVSQTSSPWSFTGLANSKTVPDQVLVGAASSAYCVGQYGKNDAFSLPHNSGADMMLGLPDYKTI